MTSPTTIQLRTRNYIFLLTSRGEIPLQKVTFCTLEALFACDFTLLLHVTVAVIELRRGMMDCQSKILCAIKRDPIS